MVGVVSSHGVWIEVARWPFCGLLVVWEKLLFLFLLFLLRRELIVQALFESCALANLYISSFYIYLLIGSRRR